MLNRATFLGVTAVFLFAAGTMGGCDEESTASGSTHTNTTGTQSGGGGAGAEGGDTSVGGSGGAGGAGGAGGMTAPGNVNCDAPTGTPGNLATQQVATGFTYPLLVTTAWGDGERLYLVEKHGTIKLIKGGVVTDFLDIESRVQSGGDSDEGGLLGLAFHPDYVNNGRFFVHYSNGGSGLPGVGNTDTVIEEYQRDASNADLADPNPVQLIFTAQQRAGNHNGGTIAFSPIDGYLWIGLGDEGGSNDGFGNGQDKDTPHGSLLRLDVDGAQPYEVPAGNITDGLATEIHDWGLRNPYRWSFDACTGDRYIGDVGQGCHEEISIAPAMAGNTNWGWNTMEGDECFQANTACNSLPTNCDQTGLTLPAVSIDRTFARSITGGHVYRGTAIPWFRGAYLYGDFATGVVWWLRWENGSVVEGPTAVNQMLSGVNNPSAFGLDNDGEIYVIDYFGGTLYQIVAE